ncbi:PaaI family thioesterase [Chelatococcus reniformis]|nr:PaaI family thioesterase [Chelatococcus reniformis]
MTHEDKLKIMRSAAYARALGLEFGSWGDGRAELRLPLHARIGADADGARIDQRALIGLLDDLSGYAVASTIAPEMGMSTVCLHIDFVQPVPPGDIVGATRCEGAFNDIVLVHGTATSPAAGLVATSTAWFHAGAYPGQSASAVMGEARERTRQADAWPDGSYGALLGARRDGDAWVVAPTPHLLGGNDNPAVHGGAVGALLATACHARLADEGRGDMHMASLSIRYLRAVRSELRATASVSRIGGRIAFIDAAIRADDGSALIATAQSLWARQPTR